MKRMALVFLLSVFLSVAGTGAALADPATFINTISTPVDGQQFTVDTLPTTIIVDGTISGGNINDQKVCITVDGSAQACEPGYVGGLGNTTSRGYSIPVSIGTTGDHTLQASNANSTGGHPAVSALITITIVLAADACDEVDPPAYANNYLNSINLPNEYATYRGGIIKIIAFNFNAGEYGSCHYDYAAVVSDVNSLLSQLGF